jgi:hypothetical protein
MLFLCCINALAPTDNVDLEEKKTISCQFTDAPIDVVIPSIRKDLNTLELCVDGIIENCKGVRRIIVVSAERLTDKAEWYNEALYPFSKADVAFYLSQRNNEKAKKLMKNFPNWVGWYYQQLLKLYAAFAIPDISSNILIVDADTIFFKPVTFLNAAHAGIYHPEREYFETYFIHARKLLPGFKRFNPFYSGISHHMLFQRCVLEELFQIVSDYHQTDFWKAFCLCTDPSNLCTHGASEYEIYFNFLFSRSSAPTIRFLYHKNIRVNDLVELNLQSHKEKGFDYGSFHVVQRE